MVASTAARWRCLRTGIVPFTNNKLLGGCFQFEIEKKISPLMQLHPMGLTWPQGWWGVFPFIRWPDRKRILFIPFPVDRLLSTVGWWYQIPMNYCLYYAGNRTNKLVSFSISKLVTEMLIDGIFGSQKGSLHFSPIPLLSFIIISFYCTPIDSASNALSNIFWVKSDSVNRLAVNHFQN